MQTLHRQRFSGACRLELHRICKLHKLRGIVGFHLPEEPWLSEGVNGLIAKRERGLSGFLAGKVFKALHLIQNLGKDV